MNGLPEKIAMVLYGLFGAGLGFLIYVFALSNFGFSVGRRPWNGMTALIICCVLGGGWGVVAYKFGDREIGSGPSSLFEDPASAALFSKRLMVIATSLASLYFLWQLAKSV
jgi:hypothetical protein